MSSNHQRSLREQLKAHHQAQVALEEQAGIAAAAQRLRREPPFYSGDDILNDHSDSGREGIQRAEEFHAEYINRRLRELYFSVSNLALRKQLIAKERKQDDLALDWWEQELFKEKAKLEQARVRCAHWWIRATVFGGVFVAVGFQLFGLAGALGGLLAGYFCGQHIKEEALAERAQGIADAEEALQETQ